ncbi:MAG: hypothetical protein JWP86_3054, partial [Phenylobacterium sp.]|nr:hypothetical protein [Phenylobacterium sp.]
MNPDAAGAAVVIGLSAVVVAIA